MSKKYGGPQYLNEFGMPIKKKPDRRLVSDVLKKDPLPNLRQKGTISAEAAKKIAQVLKILLKSS